MISEGNEGKLMKKLIMYFIKGLLLVVPVAATGYVLYIMFSGIDQLLHIKIPGLGFVIIVVFIIVLGYLSSFFLTKPLFAFFEKSLQRTPFIKVIYTAIRDLLQAFIGDKKQFDKPVLVTISKENGLQKLGFITKEDLSDFHIKDKVAVYLPHSYNFSGNLFIVPKENVQPLNISGAEALKFIVSGGVTKL